MTHNLDGRCARKPLTYRESNYILSILLFNITHGEQSQVLYACTHCTSIISTSILYYSPHVAQRLHVVELTYVLLCRRRGTSKSHLHLSSHNPSGHLKKGITFDIEIPHLTTLWIPSKILKCGLEYILRKYIGKYKLLLRLADK